jgi:carbonic anhydrase/acetyltransferase-like protein (isoleucine patch superfamily)
MHYRFESNTPNIDPEAFIAKSADIIGRVEVLAGASVWFNAVLRGDNDLIRIGHNSNVQDGSVIHTDPGFQVIVEDNVTVGHRVVLHGCHIGANTLVGINSVILNGARVGPWCLIGANSMVTSRKVIPERSLVVGSPGKVIRELTDDECTLIEESSKSYVEKCRRYSQSLAAGIRQPIDTTRL